MDIKKLQKNQSKFSLKQAKEIFDKIENKMKKNVGQLHMAIANDNAEHSQTQEFSRLIDVITNAKKEVWIMDKNSATTMHEGVGSIAAIINDTSDVSLYLILKAIKTHNKIVLFVDGKIHEATKMLIEIINSVCNEEKYDTYIDYHEYGDFKEIYEYTDKFDIFVFINNLNNYIKFTEKTKHANVIYSSYGTMSLYLDDKNLESELLRMDEYVFNNNINLDLIRNGTVEEAVQKINSNLHNYCAVIFTKDTKKAYYFIENIKADKIFVNRNPDKDYVLHLDDDLFTTRKEIFI